MDLDHILNWKLLDGSHDFPGPDGGTCINEAAIVAAGFEYRSVIDVYDLPECFSPVVGSWALAINDALPDELRQEVLIPYVTRLAGTRGTPEQETERAKTLALALVGDLIPGVLRADPGCGETAQRYVNALLDFTQQPSPGCNDPEFLSVALLAQQLADVGCTTWKRAAEYLSARWDRFLQALAANVGVGDLDYATLLQAQRDAASRAIQLLDRILELGPQPIIDAERAADRLTRARNLATREEEARLWGEEEGCEFDVLPQLEDEVAPAWAD